MTAADMAPASCAKCGGAVTVLGSGNRMCIACGAMGADTIAAEPSNVVIAPFGMAPTGEVYPTDPGPTDEDVNRHPSATPTSPPFPGSPMVPTDAPTVLADQIGGIAFLEGGQRAEVIEFPDYDHVRVKLGDGREELVNVSDVERILPPTKGEIPGIADEDIDAVPDVLIAEMALAEMIVRAAAMSVAPPVEGAAPVEIPQAFLPKGAAMLLVIERAAVSAVRSLFLIYDLDPAAVLAAIDGEPQPGETGNLQTEETNDRSGMDQPGSVESESGGK